MANIKSTLKPFVINNTDIQFLLDQVNFRPLFDSNKNAIIGWNGVGSIYDAYGNLIATGGTVVGDAASLNAIALYGTSYQTITDLSGLRDPSGFNNNLSKILSHYGQADQIFPRMTAADFTHYAQQVTGAPETLADVTSATVTSSTPVFTEAGSATNTTVVPGYGTLSTTTSWGNLTTTTTSSSTVTHKTDGHHLVRTETVVDHLNSTDVDTDNYIKSGTTTILSNHQHVSSTGVLTSTDPTAYSGGELDISRHNFGTAVTQANVNTFQDYGITNGGSSPTTTASDGSAITMHNVVDYTPRMISLTTTTAGVIFDTWSNHPSDPNYSLHAPTEIYYGNLNDQVASVADWGALATVANGGLGQVDTQARLGASAGQGDHYIGGQNPGVQGSNGFFVLFGQFFDHGLDFIDKGGNKDAAHHSFTIKIALAVDDPLYGHIGPDGKPVTEITINRATVQTVDARGPEYIDHTSPFIDQSQTYGSSSQLTTLLREWVHDPANGGVYHAGMNMFDGVTLATAWTKADGVTTTHSTLPTLNELRAHITGTGRDDISWEDVSNLRNRDANGHVLTGVNAGTSGSALILDSNPHFDLAHLHKGDAAQDLALDNSIATLTAYVANMNIPGLSFGLNSAGTEMELHIPAGFPNAGVSTGVNALGLFVNFADFSIKGAFGDLPQSAHDAVGNILLSSVGDHYIAGDGRVNENIGLTSIHHIFHEEHNYQVSNLIDALHRNDVSTGDTAHTQLHGFQIDTGHGMNAAGDYVDALGAVTWNMDKMFNATKIIVEMEYQHAAVDQYARNVTPNIQEFVGYSPNKDPGVTLEYAQAAFRFGHSTLRETIDTIDPNHGLTGKIMGYALRDAFLSPDKYSSVGAAAIINGMTHQQMNEVDEFVTPALNQGLLGQALDLAAINIARGRDIGIPTLNDFRAAIGLLKYTSWTDFGQNMQHPTSLGNFIAAYGFDGNMDKAQAIIDLASGAYVLATNTAAQNLAAGLALASTLGLAHTVAADLTAAISHATAFLSGDVANGGAGTDGFNHIDTWLGGIAEIHQPGGILGETFDKVFVNQIESLMDGDRFYYLYRLAGQQFGEEVGNGQLKDIVERNTGLEHLNGNIFGYTDQFIDLGAHREAQGATEMVTTGNEHKYGDLYSSDILDAAGHTVAAGTFISAGALTTHAGLGVYSNGGLGNANDGNVVTIGGVQYIQDTRLADTDPLSAYNQNGGVNIDGTPNSGAESHEVIVGTTNADLIYGQGGDDTVYGEGGNDTIYGGYGIDRLYGGVGNDTIYGGDNPDLIDGGAGDDHLYGESSGSDINGADQVVGGSGNDYIDGGIGIDKLSGGTGDDEIHGGQDTDPFTHGSDGNDAVYGESGGDILYGDNGDDFLSGGADQDQLFGGNGDDILRPGDATGALTIGTDEVLGGDGADDSGNKPGTFGFDIIDFSDNTLRPGGVVFDLTLQQNPATVQNGTPIQIGAFQNEGLIGSVGGDTLTGEDTNNFNGANWLIGGSGNDTLDAGGGDDVLVGGSVRLDALIGKYMAVQYDANDNAVLDAGGNTILTGLASTYDHNNGNDGLTTAQQLMDARYQGASHRVGYADQLSTDGLLDVAGFDKHFTEMLRSDQFKNTVLGDGGADGGVDVLIGGAGNDLMLINKGGASAANAAVLNGGDGSDWAVLSGGAGALAVNLGGTHLNDNTNATNVGAGFGWVKFGAVENLIGNDFGNTFTGDDSANIFKGGAEIDNFNTREGNDRVIATVDKVSDIYNGGANNTLGDTADYSAYTTGLTVTLNGGTLVTVVGSGSDAAHSDQIRNFENFVGGSGADSITGNGSANILSGGAGNDIINGGAGNDTIIWNVGDGKDTVDGGTNTAAGDTLVINGNAQAETFDVYTYAQWTSLAGHTAAADTEFVITREAAASVAPVAVPGNGDVIAEVKGIEELIINSGAGTDILRLHGNFTGTNLFTQTFHFNGTGNLTADITDLTSEHRVVVDTMGTGSIIGGVRPQDQVNHIVGSAGFSTNTDPIDSSKFGSIINHTEGVYAQVGISYSVDNYSDKYSVVHYENANNIGSWDTSIAVTNEGQFIHSDVTYHDHSSISIDYGQSGDNWISHISSFNTEGTQEYLTAQIGDGTIDTMYFNTSGQGDWSNAHYINNADGSLKHYDISNADHSGFAIDYDHSATATYDQDLVYTYADQSTYHYHHIKDGAWELVA